MNLAFYFERFGYCGEQIAAPPRSGLGIVVVIPARDEPALLGALEALWRCDRPACAVEVVVVINSSEQADAREVAANRECLQLAERWVADRPDRQPWDVDGTATEHDAASGRLER